MSHRLIALALIVCGSLALGAESALAQEDTKAAQTTLTVSAARARVTSIRTAVKQIDAQIARRAPKLSRADAVAWNEHTAWLTSVRDRFTSHADSLEGTFGDTPGVSGDMVQEMMQMNMQFLALQEAVQNESRKFSTLSNASKTRHDTAKNAISNIR